MYSKNGFAMRLFGLDLSGGQWVSAAASVGASAAPRSPPETRTGIKLSEHNGALVERSHSG